MRKPFFFLCFLAAAASLCLQAEPTPYPTGRITLKTAVVVYNPIVTNTIENAHGGIFSEEMGWGNATNTVDNIVNWWRQCSRGMVNLEVVYWTNLFQVMKNMPDRKQTTPNASGTGSMRAIRFQNSGISSPITR